MDKPRNPYAPPAAAVADAEAAPPPQNPHVELVCRLMWISLGLTLIDNILKVIREPSTAGKIGIAIGSCVGFALAWLLLNWMTRKLRAGRNWMRWLITTLALLGWASIAVFWDFFRAAYLVILRDPITMLSLGLQTLLGLVVIALLHTPTSRAWFRAHSAAS